MQLQLCKCYELDNQHKSCTWASDFQAMHKNTWMAAILHFTLQLFITFSDISRTIYVHKEKSNIKEVRNKYSR